MKLRFLLLALVLPGISTAGGREIFVAPAGAGGGDGSRGRPLVGLGAAREAARAALRAGPGPVTVSLLGGTYRLEESFRLDARDSGRPGAPMTYRAAPGEKPVVSGGKVVTGWRVLDAAAGLYEADAGKARFRQVYLDGALLTRARHPNGGWHGPFWRLKGADVKGRRLLIPPEQWREVRALAGNATLEVAWNGHWTHYRGRVGAVEEGADHVAIGIDSPEEAAFFLKPNDYFASFPFHFEDAAGFVDEVGEWYHDPRSGRLRVRFGPGVDPAKHLVEVPGVPVLLDVVGTLAEPVRHLEIRGIGFECSNWTRPSERSFASTQFAQPYDGPRGYEGMDYPPGMIRGRHATKLGIRECRIRNAGATGIQFWQDVSDSDIEGNDIGPVMANGIEIEVETGTTRFMQEEGPGTSGSQPELRSVNVAIWNNRIHECGRQYVNGGAILAHFVRGLLVDHNEIHDLPYSGIQIGNQPGGYKDWGCRDNRVRGNRIERVMQLLDDGGGIYTLGGQQRGTVIEENVIADLRRSPWTGDFWISGIYLDNFTQFVTVRRNVIVNVPTFYGAVNRAKDNTFVENEGMLWAAPDGENPRPKPQRMVAFRAMAQVEEVMKRAGIRPGYHPRAPGEAARPD